MRRGSYNQPVSKRRLTFAAALGVAAWLASAGAAAQTPSLDDVLKRSAVYVAEFRKQLSGIVAEETYRQEIADTGAQSAACSRTRPDLAIGPAARQAGRCRSLRRAARCVRGGRQGRSRSRGSRLEQLLQRSGRRTRGSRRSSPRARATTSAASQRNINTPLMALSSSTRPTSSASVSSTSRSRKPVFTDARDPAINETPVFRVSTRDVDDRIPRSATKPTIIRSPRRRESPGAGTLLDRPIERQRADQRIDRRRRRRDRDRDGQLPVGAADGIPRAGRDARVVPAISGAHYRTCASTADSGRSANSRGCSRLVRPHRNRLSGRDAALPRRGARAIRAARSPARPRVDTPDGTPTWTGMSFCAS